jgi:hypothetical protein
MRFLPQLVGFARPMRVNYHGTRDRKAGCASEKFGVTQHSRQPFPLAIGYQELVDS